MSCGTLNTVPAKPIRRDVLSLEYVKVDVFADVDPLSDTVRMTLAEPGTDNPTFHTAEWTPGQTWTSRDEAVEARWLAGPASPDGVVLTKGAVYDVKVKVTDNPEVPVFTAYQLLGV